MDLVEPQEERTERVSLAGPDPLDVLRALLKVDPDEPVEGDERRDRPDASRLIE